MKSRALLAVPALALAALTFSACTVGAPEEPAAQAVSEQNELGPNAAGLCSTGFGAFEREFLPNASTAVCKNCHKGSNPFAPPWLAGTNDQVYSMAKNYVDFANLDNSRLVIRAGNLHCGNGCNAEMAAKMKGYLQKWWDGGENSCDQSYRLRTDPMKVPADLPSDRFVTMEWDLSRLDVELRGAKMTVEIKKFTDAAGPVAGSYMIRKPRFVADDSIPIRVQGVRILNNGTFQDASNQFERIHSEQVPDQLYGKALSYPVLSAEQTFIVEERPGNDFLTVAFDKIARFDGRACKAMDKFREKVLPSVDARSCKGCHAPGAAAASTQAISRFDMSGTDDELCSKFFGRTWTNPDVLPALIQFPLYGRFDHPKVFVSAKEVVPAWNEWIEAEWQ